MAKLFLFIKSCLLETISRSSTSETKKSSLYLSKKDDYQVEGEEDDNNEKDKDEYEDDRNNNQKRQKKLNFRRMSPNIDSSSSCTATTILEPTDDECNNGQQSTKNDCNGNQIIKCRNIITNDQILNSNILMSNEPKSSIMLHKLMEKAGCSVGQMFHNAGWNVHHFNHLPQWLQDNDYILFGHRPPMASFKACFWSIFRLHTETMNIWTHGLGCLCFVALSIYLFVASTYATIPFIDKIMLGIFLTTAILCLAFSTCYHTLACHSQQVLTFVCKLDYCGISLLIAGSIVPCLYYAFYCSLATQLFYSFITIGLCAASVTVSFAEKFSEPHYRPLRASVFTSYAFSSFIPAVHWFWAHADQDVLHSSFQTAIICLISMAILYICGALVYALRIPERFYPGKFDFYFHSHQLFHIFVILAAICHLRGITSMADVRLFAQESTCQVG